MTLTVRDDASPGTTAPDAASVNRTGPLARLGALPGAGRLVRGAMVAVLGLALVGGPLATDAARPVAVSLSGMSAVIVGSGGGVNIRAAASFDAAVVTQVADGTPVTLRIDQIDTVLDPDGVTRWWPISVYGTDGWVSGYYLSDSGMTGAGLGTETEAAATDVAVAESTAAVVAPASVSSATAYVVDPEGVNVRAEAVVWAPAISFAPAGTVLVLRTDTIDPVWDTEGREWWPVDIDGQLGWVVASYLSGGMDETAPVADSGPVAASGATFAAGSYATVNTGALDGLNIRVDPAPGSAVVGYVRPGDLVQVMDGPISWESSAAGWYLVTSGGVTGYVDGDFLAAAAQLPGTGVVATAATATEAAAPVDSVGLVGTTVTLGLGDGDGVNLRSTAGITADVLATIGDGASAQVVDGPFADADGGLWYYVIAGTGEGFVSASLIGSGTPVPTVTETPVATATVPATGAPSATPTTAVTPAPSVQPTVEPTVAAPAEGEATGSFIFPVAGRVSQNYGCTSLPFYPIDPNGGCPFHDGLDIAAEQGTPIIASDGGTVSFAGWCECGLGFYVEIDHGNGYVTRYGHMASQPYVVAGQEVAQGETIGPIGSTGFSTGPHTHFMVVLDGTTIDPTSVLSSLSQG